MQTKEPQQQQVLIANDALYGQLLIVALVLAGLVLAAFLLMLLIRRILETRRQAEAYSVMKVHDPVGFYPFLLDDPEHNRAIIADALTPAPTPPLPDPPPAAPTGHVRNPSRNRTPDRNKTPVRHIGLGLGESRIQ